MKTRTPTSGISWCPFCGETLHPQSKTVEIYFNGQTFRIHKDEYREFMERGQLKFLRSPRSSPLSQDAIDLLVVLSMGLGLLLVLILIIF